LFKGMDSRTEGGKTSRSAFRETSALVLRKKGCAQKRGERENTARKLSSDEKKKGRIAESDAEERGGATEL